MRTRLDQITMREFIDLRCGEKVEGVDEKHVKDIIFEYISIVNSTEVKQILTKESKRSKTEIRLNIYRIAQIVLRLGYQKDAHDIAKLVDGVYHDESGDAFDEWLTNKIRVIEFGIKRDSDIELKKIEESVADEKQSESEIRDAFNSEIASLMSYHKMSINIDQISASVYAHLVEQTNREIQSRLRQTKKK